MRCVERGIVIFMLLSPIRNSVLEELRVRRLAVIYRKRYGVKRFFYK